MAAPAPFRRCGPRPGRAWRRGRRRAAPPRVPRGASIGSLPDGEQGERLLEAVVVVGVGAGDDQLVEQDPVRIEPGPLDAGADEHEGAGLHELREPGLHRLGLAGALEHDVDGVVDDAHRARPCSARRAPRGGAPAWRRRRRPAPGGWARARRSARRRRPWPAAPRCSSAPIGPAPSTSTRSPGWVPPWWMPWSATDSGSASAAARGSSPSGIGSTWAAGASL